MSTTTTFEAIRDGFFADLEALTPSVLARAEYAFRRCPERRVSLRHWAERNSGDASLRKFDMRIVGDVENAPILYHDAKEVNVDAVLTVAYPVLPGVYGDQDMDDAEDTIESDQRQIYDVLRSSSNWPAGMANCEVTIRGTDRDSLEDVWFKEYAMRLTFVVSSTIS